MEVCIEVKEVQGEKCGRNISRLPNQGNRDLHHRGVPLRCREDRLFKEGGGRHQLDKVIVLTMTMTKEEVL